MTNRFTIALSTIFISATAMAGLPNPPPTNVSEPTTLWLILAGVSAIALAARLRNRK